MGYNWIVSLSNGQRISSDKLAEHGNPWEVLLNYIKNNKNTDNNYHSITHIELNVNGKKYNSPTKSTKTSFKSTEVDKFWIFYKDLGNFGQSKLTHHFVSFSYKCGDYRHFLWVDTERGIAYSQVLNMFNPQTKIEKDFIMVEKDIERQYRLIYGS